MSSKIKIGTRKSELALTQTHSVARALSQKKISSSISHIVTLGDKDLRPFQQITNQVTGGDGFFTKEIERNILRKNIHMAVHSSKDLPSQTHRDLPWVAFGNRESARDILIISAKNLISSKPLKIREGLTIGTSSPRREFQLKKLFPNTKIQSIRGNVPTRIEKVARGEVDGTVLALAGVHRLNLEKKIIKQGLKIVRLPFVTAPCQGILAIQSHGKYKKIIQRIENKKLTEIAKAEKSLLAMLGGGCQLALGSHIQKIATGYKLDFYFHDTQKELEYSIKAKNLSDLLQNAFQKILDSKNGPRVVLAQSLQHLLSSARKLTAFGFQVLPWSPLEVLPTWKISEFEKIKNDFQSFDSVIFTSQFSVRIFLNEFISLYPELYTDLNKKTIYALGSATKKELTDHGIQNIQTANESHGQSLLEDLSSNLPLFVGTTDAVFLSLLKKNGRNYKFLELYKSFPAVGPLSDLPRLKDGDKVLLTSPKQVESFKEFFKVKTSRASIQIYAFGPSTSKALSKAKIKHESNPKSGSWDAIAKLMGEKNAKSRNIKGPL